MMVLSELDSARAGWAASPIAPVGERGVLRLRLRFGAGGESRLSAGAFLRLAAGVLLARHRLPATPSGEPVSSLSHGTSFRNVTGAEHCTARRCVRQSHWLVRRGRGAGLRRSAIHRVVSSARKGMTPRDPPEALQRPSQRSTSLDGVDEVAAARGLEAAVSAEQGRERKLVEAHERDHRPREESLQGARGVSPVHGRSVPLPPRSAARFPSERIDACRFSTVKSRPTRGTIMKSQPGGSSERVRRNASLSIRFIRLRRTAPPCRFDTPTPRRQRLAGSSFGSASIVINPSALGRPSLNRREMSPRRVMRYLLSARCFIRLTDRSTGRILSPPPPPAPAKRPIT